MLDPAGEADLAAARAEGAGDLPCTAPRPDTGTRGSELPKGARGAIARGGAWSTAAWITINASGAVNTVLLVRSMHHGEYGVLVMTMSVVAILSALASFGLAPALIQLAPRVGARGAATVLRCAVRMSYVLGAIAAAATGTACLVLGSRDQRELAATVAIAIPIVATAPFAASLSGYLQSVQQPRRLAGALVAAPLALTAGVVVLSLTTHPPASAIVGVRTIAVLLMVGLLLVAVRRSGAVAAVTRHPAAVDGVSPRRLLGLGGPLLGGTMTAILLAQLDVFVLGLSRGRQAVALYGPASQIADNALTMAAVVGTFYVPTIAAVLTRRDTAAAGDLYRWASRWALVWVAPVIAVMLACPQAALTLLFGGRYAPMATPLRILAAGVVVNLLFGFNGVTLDSLSRVRLIVGRQAVGLAFNVAACAVLVPLLGPDGAALATSSSLLVMNGFGSALLFRHTRITPNNPGLFAVAGALGAAVVTGMLVDRIPMPSVLQIGAVATLGAMACTAAAYLFSSEAERRDIKAGLGQGISRFVSSWLSYPST